MIISYSKIVGSQIIDNSSGSKVASIKEIVINPETGVILGVVTSNGKIISASEILKWTPDIHISDSDSIIESTEILAIDEVSKSKFNLYGTKVITKNKHDIGIVTDYIFDDNFLNLEKILVEKKILILSFDSRIIPRSEIISMSEKAIIVKDEHAYQKFKLKNFLKYQDKLPESEPV